MGEMSEYYTDYTAMAAKDVAEAEEERRAHMSLVEAEDAKILAELNRIADVYKGKTVRFTCPECKHVFLPNAKERQSAVGRSSRRKGANFERSMAKKLQKWWGNGSVWKRTPMSGGSVLKEGFDLAGDVCCNDKTMPFHWELKNSPTKFAGLHQLLTAPFCAVYDWLQQAQKDCPPHRRPILVVNRPDEPTYCMTTTDGFTQIYVMLKYTGIRYFELKCLVGDTGKVVIVWLLNDMLATTPESWRL